MQIGGFSTMGNYHDINQDSFLAEKTENGWLIAVSDGVGSCKFSQIGSARACKSVKSVLEKYGGVPEDIDAFFRDIHTEWISSLFEMYENPDVNDFCATLLFCYFSENKLYAARLGDGFIGIHTNDKSFVLFDDKENHLMNETDSLSEQHDPAAWEALELECDSVTGVFISTDGLSVFPHNDTAFNSLLKDLVGEYANKTSGEIEKDMALWIPKWESNDDKTMAFMIGE